MPAALLVTIDTEEEFDWSAAGVTTEWSLEHVPHLARLQELFERYGVRPTYVVDYAIATDDGAVALLGSFQRRGACEIGAHLHPWLNPPVDEELSARNSFLSNLPLSLQQEKVARLSEVIVQAFGRPARVFKAGRYALDFRLAPYLASLGYRADTSVIAYTSFAADDGPDFSEYGCQPYWIRSPSLAAGSERANGKAEPVGLLEVPCTVGFNRRPFRLWSAVHRTLSHERLRPLHPIGILDRLGLVRKIAFSPELAPLSRLKQVLRAAVGSGAPMVNLTLHSPSVLPGGTPYVRTREDLEAFYRTLEGIFEYALGAWAMRPLTISEFYDDYSRSNSDDHPGHLPARQRRHGHAHDRRPGRLVRR